MQHTPYQQQGLTFIAWVIILTMAAVFLIVGVKMVPVYIEYYSVRDVINTITTDTDIPATAKKDIETAFLKRLRTNNISLSKDEYSILKVKGKRSFAIQVDYKVEKSLFSNLSLVSHFTYAKEMGETPLQ